MGNISITQAKDEEKARQFIDSEWEIDSYREGCALARKQAIKRLGDIEERLFRQRPTSWKVIGFRARTFITRFGEVKINRRLYQDSNGSYHFLLDEHLGWLPNQNATPDLQECLVKQASYAPFRPVSETLEKLTAGIISASTIHRLLQETAKAAIAQEEINWRALFEKGDKPSGSERKVSILFCEGDGVWIHLQREKQRQYEIKDAIAYEGWRRLSSKEERYALVNKRVYCQANDEIPFWEGVSLEWARKWDFDFLKEIVIGGDGANWIDNGIGEFAHSVRQLDGFHLARACGRGWQDGKAIYEAIRAGDVSKARDLINYSVPRKGSGVNQARRYVKRNIEKGKDWRIVSGVEGRALGTMESNEDKLVANRMKKRGLSWMIGSGCRMAKVIQLAANKEIRPYCLRKNQPTLIQLPRPLILKPRSSRDDSQKWLQAGIPALTGPHASKIWVENLRRISHHSYLLN
jgi:hypothetical protein